MKKSKTTEEAAVAAGRPQRDSLISMLQEAQDKEGYLSREDIIAISRQLGLPASKVYGVATFYNQFRMHPPGKYHIQICRGTACHIKGSNALLARLIRELRIQPGETTKDGLFSLEVVACIGACGLAPVMVVGGTYYSHLTPDGAADIVRVYRKGAKERG
ncbi:MAG: NADH-quinone oxidoreductase subunit NuoE [Spirochaetales bacterium]|nr:NADH-quinone oxidoreductase subunit NuoE [Spirochaetales bacterium]